MEPANIQTRQCDCCGKESSSTFRCSGCKQAFYCNRNCQRIAWKGGHKQDCKYEAKLQAIHSRLARLPRQMTMTIQNGDESTPTTPAQNRKTMLDRVLAWYAVDDPNGLNFPQFVSMLDDLLLHEKEKRGRAQHARKWCEMCRKHALGEPDTARFKQEEIWGALVDIGQAVVARKKQEKQKSDSAYLHAFRMLMLLWTTARDYATLPFTQQEICEAIVSVTPLLSEIAAVAYSYTSEIDAEFAIGECDVYWMHDNRNTKPLPLLLRKYEESELIELENQQSYWYDVVYLRTAQDVCNDDGKAVAVVDVLEISIRIEDSFNVVDEQKCREHTFVLGTSVASRMCFLFGMADHAELVTQVLQHHGLDVKNIRNFYVGKHMFGARSDDPIAKLTIGIQQQKFVNLFNKKTKANSRHIDENAAYMLGTFSENAYNIDKPKHVPQRPQRNVFADIFGGVMEDVFRSTFG